MTKRVYQDARRADGTHAGWIHADGSTRALRRTRRNYRRAARLLAMSKNPQAAVFLRRARNG